jgi:uncharacterized protein YndB with AHSA1/START domain
MNARSPNVLRLTTPTDTSLLLTRTFAAPRRAVWDAMTLPALMRQWMVPPPGWSLSACACDPRVAGALHLAWKCDDSDETMALLGVFTEVIPHERLVHTEVMVLGSGDVIGAQIETHEFLDTAGATEMRITQVLSSREARDAATASGMEHSMETGYANLEAFLARS